MKTTVSVYEAKAHLSELISTVERSGNRIVICRHGKPVADLMAHRESGHDILKPDPALLGAHFLVDPCAQLSPEDWPEAQR